MTEPDPTLTTETLNEIVTLVREIERAGEDMPADARAAYLESRQSIIDARRSAESDENPLQLSW